MTARRPGRAARAGRRLLWSLLAVLAGVAGALVLHQTSVQPGAELVRVVFDRAPEVTPPAGFGRIAGTVAERRVPVPVPGAPAAHLDVYTPDGGGGGPRPGHHGGARRRVHLQLGGDRA